MEDQMKLEQAEQIAESLKADLSPYCDRIEIAGSIRRKKPEVKDIELMCIPKFADIGTGQTTLFGGETTITENVLFTYLASKSEWPIIKMGEKYCQFEHIDEWPGNNIKVDLFTATPETWGYIFLLRTGPAEFSKWVVTELKRRGYVPKDGVILKNGYMIQAHEEKAVFRMLGIDYIEPEYRFKDVMWK